MVTRENIVNIFAKIAEGDMPGFFAHVEQQVNWIVKGTFCPIAGDYKSLKEFQQGTSALSSTWATPLTLETQNITFDGHRRAAVELKAVDVKCKNGLAFTNEYVWICHFNEYSKIEKIIAFMDTDLVTKAIEQNPS